MAVINLKLLTWLLRFDEDEATDMQRVRNFNDTDFK
jgi:hypothetical protein